MLGILFIIVSPQYEDSDMDFRFLVILQMLCIRLMGFPVSSEIGKMYGCITTGS